MKTFLPLRGVLQTFYGDSSKTSPNVLIEGISNRIWRRLSKHYWWRLCRAFQGCSKLLVTHITKSFCNLSLRLSVWVFHPCWTSPWHYENGRHTTSQIRLFLVNLKAMYLAPLGVSCAALPCRSMQQSQSLIPLLGDSYSHHEVSCIRSDYRWTR